MVYYASAASANFYFLAQVTNPGSSFSPPVALALDIVSLNSNVAIKKQLVTSSGSPCRIGVDDHSLQNSFSVFPNPAFDYLDIKNVNSIDEIRSIKVTTVLGHQLFPKIDKTDFNNYKVIFDSSILSGQYIVTIYTDGIVFNKKFTVTK